MKKRNRSSSFTKSPCWRGKVAFGQEKQKAHIILNSNFLCLSCPSATFALQHSGFVLREWQATKGLFENSLSARCTKHSTLYCHSIRRELLLMSTKRCECFFLSKVTIFSFSLLQNTLREFSWVFVNMQHKNVISVIRFSQE